MPSVLCFGDSNTHGTQPMASHLDGRRFDAATRWPGVLRAALGAGWEVVEEGLPGRTTVMPDPVNGPVMEGIAVLDPILNSHRPLDLVIVMLGTNDLKARFGLGPADIAEGCYRIAREIRVSDTGPWGGGGDGTGEDMPADPLGVAPAVLLVCPPPITETGWLAEMFAGGAAKSRALAPHLERIAGEVGASFFDAGTVIATDPLDGIHFSAESHRALGLALAAPVRAAVGH